MHRGWKPMTFVLNRFKGSHFDDVDEISFDEFDRWQPKPWRSVELTPEVIASERVEREAREAARVITWTRPSSCKEVAA
jgi:hypothetical protein